MIFVKNAKKYCKDDISKIENYEEAINSSETWECHHRLEFTLNGEPAKTKEELIRLKMYWKRPYFELIFLSPSEHAKLHRKVINSKRIGVSTSKFGELMNKKYGTTGIKNLSKKLYDREYYWFKKTGHLDERVK